MLAQYFKQVFAKMQYDISNICKDILHLILNRTTHRKCGQIFHTLTEQNRNSFCTLYFQNNLKVILIIQR